MVIKAFNLGFQTRLKSDGNQAGDLRRGRFFVNTGLQLKRFLFGLKEIRKDKGPMIGNSCVWVNLESRDFP